MNNRIDGEAEDVDELMHVGCKMTQKYNIKIRGQPSICNTRKYMGVEEHYRRNQDQAVQEQRFEHTSEWVRNPGIKLTKIISHKLQIFQNKCLLRIFKNDN